MHKANLNLLPTLKVLLETRNISRAAELLHLSQPSISKQLGQLRSEFGDELLVREGQRWLLTPRAESLAAALADSLGALDRLYAAPEFAPERCERVFRLASSDYVAQHILPDICAALARAAPRAALEYSLWDKRQLPQLWQSELVPHGFIVLRNAHGDTMRGRAQRFLAQYGRGSGAQAEQQRAALKGLHDFAGFLPADNRALLPVTRLTRQLDLDSAHSATWINDAARQARLARIDARYAEQMAVLRQTER